MLWTIECIKTMTLQSCWHETLVYALSSCCFSFFIQIFIQSTAVGNIIPSQIHWKQFPLKSINLLILQNLQELLKADLCPRIRQLKSGNCSHFRNWNQWIKRVLFLWMNAAQPLCVLRENGCFYLDSESAGKKQKNTSKSMNQQRCVCFAVKRIFTSLLTRRPRFC